MQYKYKLGWHHSNEVRIKFTLLLTEERKVMSCIIKINFFHYNFRIIQILNVYDKTSRDWHLKDTQATKSTYTCILLLWGNYSFICFTMQRKKHYVVSIIYLVIWMLSADWWNDSNFSFFPLHLKFNLGRQRSLTILVSQHLTPKQTA